MEEGMEEEDEDVAGTIGAEGAFTCGMIRCCGWAASLQTCKCDLVGSALCYWGGYGGKARHSTKRTGVPGLQKFSCVLDRFKSLIDGKR